MNEEIIVQEPEVLNAEPIPCGPGIEYAKSLRMIADFYEENPTIPIPEAIIQVYSISGKVEMQQAAKALKTFNKVYDDQFFRLTKKFGILELHFVEYREKVCKKVVTGTHTVKKLIPKEYVEVEEVVEKFEWECSKGLLTDQQKALEEI